MDLTYWQWLGGKLADVHSVAPLKEPSSSSVGSDMKDDGEGKGEGKGEGNGEEEEEEDEEDGPKEPHWEYLVKWRNSAYVHCEWITEDEVIADAPPEGKKRLAVRVCRSVLHQSPFRFP